MMMMMADDDIVEYACRVYLEDVHPLEDDFVLNVAVMLLSFLHSESDTRSCRIVRS